MKKTLLMCAMVSMSLVASAETNTMTFAKSDTIVMVKGQKAPKAPKDPKAACQDNGWRNRWFINAGVGLQAYRGENDWKMRLQDNIGYAFDLGVGRWMCPGFALDLNFNFARFRGLWLEGDKSRTKDVFNDGHVYSTTDKEFEGQTLIKQKGYYLNTTINAMFDIPEMVNGYNPYRRSSFIPMIGVGYMQGLGSKGSNASSWSVNLGFMYKYRVSDNVSLYGQIKGAVVGDNFDGEENGRVGIDGLANLSAGVIYTFGKMDGCGAPEMCKGNVMCGKAPKPGFRKGGCVNGEEYGRLTAGRDIIINSKASTSDVDSNLNDIIAKLLNANQKHEPVPAAVEKEIQSAFPYYVGFSLDNSVVSNKERVNLKIVALIMKSMPNLKFQIKGYADKQTGSEERNKVLSVERSKSVYNVLVNEMEVPASQLSTADFGGVDNMFYNDNTLSRCVIIAIQK